MAINTPTNNGVIRELAIRHTDGGTITLYWNSATEEITLEVKTSGSNFSISDVPKDSALEAWNHPYAFADHALKTGRYHEG
jgi:hypothetical protein